MSATELRDPQRRPEPEQITGLLRAWQRGESGAQDRLLVLLYPHLRALAARRLAAGRRPLTLETTELVHECYLKLVDQRHVCWENRAHFFAIAARLMRRIVVDRARRRNRQKRGRDRDQIALDEVTSSPEAEVDWLAIDEALGELGRVDPQAVRIVELRFFVGLTSREAADALGVSESSVARGWRFARAWLQRHLAAVQPAHGGA